MKRWIAGWLILALMLCCPALAERIEYADQGGVRVFEEETGFGLMDSDGNVLLPAEYDSISPFEDDFAIIGSYGSLGVVRRDGSIAIQCQGSSAKLYPDERLAAVNDKRLYDLDTGALLVEAGNHVSVRDDLLFAANWSEEDNDYHTQVLDKDGRVRFEADGEFDVDGLQPSAGLVFRVRARRTGLEGRYRLIDADGRWMMEPFDRYNVGDDGSLYYARMAHMPLCTLLLRTGYDREHVRRGMEYHLGISMALSGTLTEFMQVQEPRCGVVRPDGSRMEVRGTSMLPRDGAGLYRVCAEDDGTRERWGYLDESGAFVIDPRYDRAWPFVDGAAVVESSGTRFLIDSRGSRVENLAWTADDDNSYDELDYPLIPVPVGVFVQLVDRRGRVVSDEPFRSAWPRENRSDRFMVLLDTQDRVCAIDTQRREILRFEADSCVFVTRDHHMIMARDDGRGLVCLAGKRAGEWIIPPVFYFWTTRPFGGYEAFGNPYEEQWNFAQFDADGRLITISGMDLEAHRELMKVLGQYDDGGNLP